MNDNLKSNDSSLTIEARKKWYIFKALKDFYPMKIYFKNEGKAWLLRWRTTKNFSPAVLPKKRMVTGNSINRNKMIIARILEHQQGRNIVGNFLLLLSFLIVFDVWRKNYDKIRTILVWQKLKSPGDGNKRRPK